MGPESGTSGFTGWPPGGIAPIRIAAVQPPLPALAARMIDRPSFAHPFERDFAALLDGYGLRWRYEPTTFLLASRADGRPAECFTPDFYLPDVRTYIELTSMRQSLVTRKHGKLRRFRAVSPGTRVVLLYRRDYHRMLAVWAARSRAGAPVAPRPVDLGRVVVPTDALVERLTGIATGLAASLGVTGPAPTLVGLGAGGARVAADLARRLDDLGRPAPASRAALLVAGGRVRVREDDRRGGPVILVTGMVSTGLSADHASRWLRRRGTQVIGTVAMLERATARVTTEALHHVGFVVPSDLLVGYGLDLHDRFSHLNYVAAVAGPPGRSL